MDQKLNHEMKGSFILNYRFGADLHVEIESNEQNFYKSLKVIKDEFKNVEGTRVMPFNPEETGLDIDFELAEVEKLFTGEEGLGRHLDLNDLYMQYLNLPSNKIIVESAGTEQNTKTDTTKDDKITYLKYLALFDRFYDIKQSIKSSVVYKTYVQNMTTYLIDFYKRAQPLFDVNDLIESAHTEFADQWKEGTVRGWVKPSSDSLNTALYCIPCIFTY